MRERGFLDNPDSYGEPKSATQKGRMPLRFEPQPMEELRARYDEAVSVVYDARPDKSVRLNMSGLRPLSVSDWPGMHRRHVFDFQDGLRIVVSREVFDNDSGTFLHWSAQMNHIVTAILKELGKDVPAMIDFVIRHMAELWGDRHFTGEVRVSKMPDIMHFTYKESQAAVQKARECCQFGDPILN